MKINKTLALFLAAAFTVGCQESQDYVDVVYFTGTEDTPVTSMYVDGPAAVGVTVSSSRKVEKNVAVSIAVDPSAVISYNAANGTSYRMLPDNSYRLEADYATISADKHVSAPVKFEILTMDDFEEGVLYCAPLRITGTSDGTGILAASQVQYLVVNQIITTKASSLPANYYYSAPTMKNDPDLADMGVCTMECRVMPYGFQSSNPYISSVVGIEENFLLRFGDVSCPKDKLQAAGRGTSITSNTTFNTNQWYHIAVVDDGSEIALFINGEKESATSSSGKGAINLAWDYQDGFHVGRSERGRLLNGAVSEVRVWRRALSGIELKNNQCYVDPTSEGLVAYWRMDEVQSDGRTIKDLTGHGYDLYSSSATVRWTDEIKCPIVE